MGNPYAYDLGFAAAPFTANSPVTLLDVSSMEPMILPAGSYITKVFFKQGSLSSGGNLSLGWSGNPGAIIPTGVGITTALLNTAGVLFNPVVVTQTGVLGINLVTTYDHKSVTNTTAQTLTITSDANIASGRVDVGIEYITFDNIPNTN